jgi:hypothetical protein
MESPSLSQHRFGPKQPVLLHQQILQEGLAGSDLSVPNEVMGNEGTTSRIVRRRRQMRFHRVGEGRSNIQMFIKTRISKWRVLLEMSNSWSRTYTSLLKPFVWLLRFHGHTSELWENQTHARKIAVVLVSSTGAICQDRGFGVVRLISPIEMNWLWRLEDECPTQLISYEPRCWENMQEKRLRLDKFPSNGFIESFCMSWPVLCA